MRKERRSTLLQHASKVGYNAVAAFQPENVFYLTDFWGEAVVICIDDKTKLIAPKLEVDRAQQSSKDCEIVSTERGSDLISTFISEVNGKIICTDCSDYSTIEAIQNKTCEKSFAVNNEPFFEPEELKMKKKSKQFRKQPEL